MTKEERRAEDQRRADEADQRAAQMIEDFKARRDRIGRIQFVSAGATRKIWRVG